MDIQLDPLDYPMNGNLVALAIEILRDVTGAEPDEGGALHYCGDLYDHDRWTAEVVLGLLELTTGVGDQRGGELLVAFLKEATEALHPSGTT